MRAAKLLPMLTLCLASSLALAEERNCSELENREARQECMQRRANTDVDCSTINDSRARRECAQRKQQNGADCSKLATAEMRQQCMEQKGK